MINSSRTDNANTATVAAVHVPLERSQARTSLRGLKYELETSGAFVNHEIDVEKSTSEEAAMLAHKNLSTLSHEELTTPYHRTDTAASGPA